jgi:aminopeptidase-like protein
MKCFDWEIPDEWNISDAYITDEQGVKVVDFSKNNLHVLGYSEPVNNKTFSLNQLKEYIYTLPDQPEVIPYLTSYYERRWGFCMSHNELCSLKDGNYTVNVDSTLEPGFLTLGEAFLPGKTDKEILISCYICHPSMANDSISGVVLTTDLYKKLSQIDRYYSYRFLFVPETIGSIAYLSQNQDRVLEKTYGGFVVTCVGGAGMFTYQRSIHKTHVIDRIAENVLKNSGKEYKIRSFRFAGSDELQYSSPGFNLPVGSLMRTAYPHFTQYHTSADNLDLVTEDALNESLEMYLKVIKGIEGNNVFRNNNPYCSPKLDKRGLYRTLGSQRKRYKEKSRMTWLLNYSNGENSLIDIAEEVDTSILNLIETSEKLKKEGLLTLDGRK